MDKNTTKKYIKYNDNVLEALFIKYGVSKYYIRQCVSGRKTGITPDAILKDYKTMEIESKLTIDKLINKTL